MGDPGVCSQETPARRQNPWALWLAVAALAAGAQALNLLHAASEQGCDPTLLRCSEGIEPFSTADTDSYLELARSIRLQGFFTSDYTTRPAGYPLMLATSLLLTGKPLPALWLNVILAGLAGLAVAWLAVRFTGNKAAGIAAALLFACWPNVYQWSPLLLSDTPHAFLAVCAFAATLRWRDTARSRWALLAGAAWLATQALRPTFMAVPVLLPLLLWKRGGRRYLALSVVVWLTSFIAPGFQLIQNEMRHGELFPAESPQSFVTLQCYASSRLRAELEDASFEESRDGCLEAKRIDPHATAARELDYLLSRPAPATVSYALEIFRQLRAPLRPFYYKRQAESYPSWWRLGRGFMAFYWLTAGAGWLLLLRRDRRTALFLAGLAAMVLLPAGLTHWVGARIRFPLDLLFLPVAVLTATLAVTRLLQVSKRLGRTKGKEDPVSA